jgi:hypothetical protein
MIDKKGEKGTEINAMEPPSYAPSKTLLIVVSFRDQSLDDP